MAQQARNDMFGETFGWSDRMWWALLGVGIALLVIMLCCCFACLQRARRKGREEAFKVVHQQQREQQRQRRRRNNRASQAVISNRTYKGDVGAGEPQYHASRDTSSNMKTPTAHHSTEERNEGRHNLDDQHERIFAKMAPTTAALLHEKWNIAHCGETSGRKTLHEQMRYQAHSTERNAAYCGHNDRSRAMRAKSYHEVRQTQKGQCMTPSVDHVESSYVEFKNQGQHNEWNDRQQYRSSDTAAPYSAWQCDSAAGEQYKPSYVRFKEPEISYSANEMLHADELQASLDIDIDSSFISAASADMRQPEINALITNDGGYSNIDVPSLSDRITELREKLPHLYLPGSRETGTESQSWDHHAIDIEAKGPMVSSEDWQRNDIFIQTTLKSKFKRPQSPVSTASSCFDTESCTTLNSKKSSEVDERDLKALYLRKQEENLSVISALTDGQFEDAESFIMMQTPTECSMESYTKSSLLDQSQQIQHRESIFVPLEGRLDSPTYRESFEV